MRSFREPRWSPPCLVRYEQVYVYVVACVSKVLDNPGPARLGNIGAPGYELTQRLFDGCLPCLPCDCTGGFYKIFV